MPFRRPDLVSTYVYATIALGAAALVALVLGAGGSLQADLRPALVAFTLAMAIGEFVQIRVVLRGAEGEITISTTFAFAALLEFGPVEAALALALASITADALRRKAPVKALFNAAQYVLAVAIAGVFLSIADVPHHAGLPFLPRDLPAVLLAGAGFYAVNTALVGTVIALVEKVNIWRHVSRDSSVQALSAGLLLGLSPILVIVGQFSVAALPLLFLPLFAIWRGERQAERSAHQALHDGLTGLPNRVMFSQRLEEAVGAARAEKFAVMLMDVDHFKEVNDTLGHHHGDILLRKVAERLETCVRPGDTVARLGGDEFAILLPEIGDVGHAVDIARRVIRTLREPTEIEDLSLDIAASIGIAVFPDHGDRGEVLLRRADIAMYTAKRARTGHSVYADEQDGHSPKRLTLTAELRQAIDKGQLEVHYQPKAHLATGSLRGVEALVRWRHPTRGLIPPTEFIPLAERSGLIAPLTSVVLDEALRQSRAWQDLGVRIPVAVNLSARSFMDTTLPAEIQELLERWSTSPELLQLEVTESMLMSDPQRAKLVIDRLTRQGLRLSIDDFGTGYSSLAQLKQLPVSEIKIDKSFVMDMGRSASDAAIVGSTIDLAHNLGLAVIAEGVEDAESWEMLKELGCDLAQGYFLSRPLPADLLTPVLAGDVPLLQGPLLRVA